MFGFSKKEKEAAKEKKLKKEQEKVLVQMKKKTDEISKLKSEVNNMGKLVLIGGKLTRTDDVPKAAPTPQPDSFDEIASSTPIIPVRPAMPSEDQLAAQQEEFERQQYMAQVQQQQAQQQAQQQEFERQQYAMQQQELAERQQYAMQQQELAERQQYAMQQQELAERQQYARQQQAQQPLRQPQSRQINIVVELSNGGKFAVAVSNEKFEDFIDGINAAIDNQSSYPIANRVVNGRNIIQYIID